MVEGESRADLNTATRLDPGLNLSALPLGAFSHVKNWH
jgi:hypothetical protein